MPRQADKDDDVLQTTDEVTPVEPLCRYGMNLEALIAHRCEVVDTFCTTGDQWHERRKVIGPEITGRSKARQAHVALEL